MSNNLSLCEQVLEFGASHTPKSMVMKGFATLTGENLDETAMQAELNRIMELKHGHRNSGEALSADDLSRIVAVDGLFQIVRDNLSEGNALVDWPAFEGMVRQHGQPANGSATSVAVGIGKDPVSARAFDIMNGQLLGADQLIIVDYESGRDVRQHGDFMQWDGERIPLEDSSVEFVLTDRMYYRPGAFEEGIPTGAVESVMAEAHRVLRPGGQLLMVEFLPGADSAYQPGGNENEIVKLQLEMGAVGQVGFSVAKAEDAPLPLDTDFLFGTGEDRFANIGPIVDSDVYTLYARK